MFRMHDLSINDVMANAAFAGFGWNKIKGPARGRPLKLLENEKAQYFATTGAPPQPKR